MKNITDTLCDFALSLNYSDIPEPTLTQTKKFIADYFAASFAGIRVNQTLNEAVLKVIQSFGGKEQASVLLEKGKYPVPAAAYINAIYAHGADLDDGNRISAGHIGAHVISSVFALAEDRDLFWKDVIVAINVGYEFFNRIGGACQPDLYNKGFHSTGVIGAVAASAACAKLIGLNREKIYDSISVASFQAAGLIIIDESGQGCKPINPANAAKTGVFSALLAEQGVDSPRNPLESEKGWLHAFGDKINTNCITEKLGENFTINESYLKLYPTCRHTHSCIEAALELREQLLSNEMYEVELIKKIQVFIYPSAIKSAGTIITPNNSEEAKFSIPFAIAVALARGRFDLQDLISSIVDESVQRLAKLVELIPDKTIENREKGIRGARVQIVLLNDMSFEKKISTPKGEGKDSLTWDMLEEKIIGCANSLMDQHQARDVLLSCKNIDENEKFSYPGSVLV